MTGNDAAAYVLKLKAAYDDCSGRVDDIRDWTNETKRTAK